MPNNNPQGHNQHTGSPERRDATNRQQEQANNPSESRQQGGQAERNTVNQAGREQQSGDSQRRSPSQNQR